jgi:hypothetical protein
MERANANTLKSWSSKEITLYKLELILPEHIRNAFAPHVSTECVKAYIAWLLYHMLLNVSVNV